LTDAIECLSKPHQKESEPHDEQGRGCLHPPLPWRPAGPNEEKYEACARKKTHEEYGERDYLSHDYINLHAYQRFPADRHKNAPF